ncbi:(d)CMP kinase [Alkalibacter rhizosphaerae]|uniref:Cytidylate kinase n=1 Tax=Alkalibacter rhizosphaerae TaxID=2815577 RepID=A0A975AHX7_9FIRM|nr:(d)CMP kinase [Alkalibacter rhizosphaerae]QSX08902.1 (d)CMP kinase [Alkalibacter rhizosphaerae]
MKIAIDGPAGAGKSTIAKLVAAALGIDYLDTGAMYRAVALQVLKGDKDPEDPVQVLETAKKAEISFMNNQICVQGENVGEAIRTPQVNRLVSKVAKIPELREWMVEKQREISRTNDVIMDGRDIGSVVLPDADHKFYLDASIDIRARRRYDEQPENKDGQSLEDIKEDIRRRDAEDRNRLVGPLTIAHDAIVIDTSHMGVDEVVAMILKRIKE